MKYIKLTIVLALLIGAICGAWKVLHRDGVSPQPLSVVADAQINAQERNRLDERIGRLHNSWNDDEFGVGLNYIHNSDRHTAADLLETYYYTHLLDTLHSKIKQVYASNPAKVAFGALPGMEGAHRGLDTIKARYTMARNSELYRRPQELRSLYTDIYNYSLNTMSLGPQIKITLRGEGADATMSHSWRSGIHSYADYRSSMDRRRRDLLNRYNAAPEFAAISWMAPALSQSTFDGLATSRKAQAYLEAERRNIVSQLNRAAALGVANAAVADAVEQLCRDLPDNLRNQEIVNARAAALAVLRPQ